MEAGAKKSAGQLRERPVAAVAYTTYTAYSHWSGNRATEFEALLQAWNTATARNNGGGALLQELSARCDREDADLRGTPVENSDGRVFEFTVTLEPGMAPARIWRGLDGNGVPNLRLAPKPNNEQARASLLKEMEISAKKRAGKRKK
jgi:hypothetical protein